MRSKDRIRENDECWYHSVPKKVQKIIRIDRIFCCGNNQAIDTLDRVVRWQIGPLSSEEIGDKRISI